VDALDDVARLHVHGDGVAGGGDGVGEALDFGEGLLETVLEDLLAPCFFFSITHSQFKTYPLWFILLPTLRNRDWVRKDAIVRPKLQLLEGRAAGEEVEDGADDGLLVVGEGDAGGGLDLVEVLDVETGWECWWGRGVSVMFEGGGREREKG
jgi:hypothetical protein